MSVSPDISKKATIAVKSLITTRIKAGDSEGYAMMKASRQMFDMATNDTEMQAAISSAESTEQRLAQRYNELKM